METDKDFAVTCPTCRARAGEPCQAVFGGFKGVTLDRAHKSRARSASATRAAATRAAKKA